jgi:hypothetical protein
LSTSTTWASFHPTGCGIGPATLVITNYQDRSGVSCLNPSCHLWTITRLTPRIEEWDLVKAAVYYKVEKHPFQSE